MTQSTAAVIGAPVGEITPMPLVRILTNPSKIVSTKNKISGPVRRHIGKGDCHEGSQPRFNLWDLGGGAGINPARYPLAFTRALWHEHACAHAH